MSRTPAQFLIEEWGIPADRITESLEEQARSAMDSRGMRIGELIARTGLASQETIDHHLARKPPKTLTLAYLFEHIDGLRAQSQRILAAHERMAYLDGIEAGDLHPAFQANTALRKWCEDNTAVPLVADDPKRIRIVFANHDSHKAYQQSSRLDRSNDPIGRLTTETKEPIVAVWALGNRDQIAPLLRNTGTQDIQTVDDERLNVWDERAATTSTQKLLGHLLSRAAQLKATNIQFTPEENGLVSVRYRLHGLMVPAPDFRPLTPQQAAEIARFLHVKSQAKYNDNAKRVEGQLLTPADGQFVFKTTTSETFLRCGFMPVASNGLGHALESLSLRLLPRDTLTIELEKYRIHNQIISVLRDFIAEDYGFLLVAGPTSSGKSTLIAGGMNEHEKHYGDSKHRLSLEHPVERKLHGITQVQVHGSLFELYMAALLRHDPDTIWIGELRDRATAATCIRAANTGHQVFSTIHSNDAPTAIGAVLAYIRNTAGASAQSVMVTEHDAVDSLSLVIAQRLVPELCPDCRVPLNEDGKRKMDLEARYNRYCQRKGIKRDIALPDGLYVANPKGCNKHEHCFGGYIAEHPVNEYVHITDDLREVLRNNVNAGRYDLHALQKARPYTLHQDAFRLASAGMVSIEHTMF